MQSLLHIITIDSGIGHGWEAIQHAESESVIIGALVLLLCYILQGFKIQSGLKYLTMPGIEIKYPVLNLRKLVRISGNAIT